MEKEESGSSATTKLPHAKNRRTQELFQILGEGEGRKPKVEGRGLTALTKNRRRGSQDGYQFTNASM